MVVAYVSTETNSFKDLPAIENIYTYAKENNIIIDKWIKEAKKKSVTKLISLIEKLQKEDVLIVENFSQISFHIIDIIHIIVICLSKRIRLYPLNDNLKFLEGDKTQELIFLLSLIIEIDSTIISQKTCRILWDSKEKGVRLGRPKGSFKKKS